MVIDNDTTEEEAPNYGVSMIRLTDESGSQVVAACVPQEGFGPLGVEDPEGWLHGCIELDSIILDTSGVVQITDSRDATALSAWLSAAAIWLRVRELGTTG